MTGGAQEVNLSTLRGPAASTAPPEARDAEPLKMTRRASRRDPRETSTLPPCRAEPWTSAKSSRNSEAPPVTCGRAGKV